jgi:putative hemolysin
VCLLVDHGGFQRSEYVLATVHHQEIKMSLADLDILLVLLLIGANGLFSMAEIAIVSARKSRLQQLAKEGSAKAQSALDLADSPNLLLSTVQIGITLVGILSGAFGGASIAVKLSKRLDAIPLLAPYSETISLIFVVLTITYLTLVVGELVPKRLALNNPESIASIAAGPMRIMSVIASPAVTLLSASTDFVLRLLRMRPSSEPPITEEEIKVLIEQGTLAGVFEEAEQEMVERVLWLGDRRVGVIMTPRKKIVWLDVRDSAEKIRRKILRSAFSRFPVSQGRLGNILGVVSVKDLLARSLEGQSFELKASLKQPLFVQENMHVLKVMELFRKSGTVFALVIDEYGTIEGLVTLTDILESIVGDMPSPDEIDEPRIVQRADGSWLVDGMLPVDELKGLFDIKKLPGERTGYYQTLGGFIMLYLKRIPAAGDSFECCGLRFEIVDMDGRRVDKVLIELLQEKQVEDAEKQP